jgi:glycosyltransferase involved in cell wall biosynthesis
MKRRSKKNPEISIILPCRNEEKALPLCLKEIKNIIKKYKLSAEIIVSDSSSDSSPKIAIKNKVILVKHDKDGYGNAYLEAYKIAKGKYIFMADADCTYDFNEIPRFINELKNGSDFVIGNRFSKKIQKESMSFSHRYIGNPILSGILRLFFGTSLKDAHSGMRAISREALNKLRLKTTGMEFASEMIVKALKNNLKIKELPIDYRKRQGTSKLNSFRDAWRHLRFMLLYSPLFLFFIPGMLLFFIGLATLIWFYLSEPTILGIKLFYHPMFFSSLLTIIGYQLIIFSAFAKSYSINHLEEYSPTMEKLYKYITIEKASIIGIIGTIIGISLYAFIIYKWLNSGFGSLNEIKNSILALTLTIIGVQTIFSSFMLSILGIKEK